MVNEINNQYFVGSSLSAKQPPANAREHPDGTKSMPSDPIAANGKANKDRSPAIVDSSNLEKAVDELNKHVLTVGRALRFSVDRESGHTIIKVMDRETEQIVRQIPPEEAIALAKFLHQTNDLSSTGLVEEA